MRFFEDLQFKNIEIMIAQNLHNADIKFIPFKNKPLTCISSTKSALLAPLTKVLPQRNAVIEWIYRAQRALGFSRSSLFLGIALLDKLLTNGMPLTDANCQLIGGTVTLLITKFNEVYPVTVRKLHALSSQHISLEKYVETEGLFLQTIGFDLSPEDPIYESLAELEFKLGGQSQETIKTAVTNPAVAFKMGSSALLAAIQSMAVGGLMERKNECRLSRESAELRVQLQRLRSRSPGQKRLVSPQRA